jgi:beta-exotoxin I transport system ATP-binding protein
MIRQGEIVEVAETSALVHRALRQITVQFKEPVDSSALAAVPGVTLLRHDDGTRVTLQVEGDMDRLIVILGDFPVRDLETTRPSLEELFLAYYRTT